MLLLWIPAAALAQPTMLVGELTQQADRKCTETGDSWVNPRLEVGFVPLVGELPGAKPLFGQAVIVRGVVAPAPVRPKVENTAACQELQMRSDWQIGMHGMRVRRLDVAPIAGFRAESVKALEGFSATLDGDQVVVTFQNTTGAPLTDVAIKVHYEGCYGKPGTATETRRTPTMKPNSTATARVPQVLIKKARHRPRTHVMREVSVLAKGSHVVFDLTVDGFELGAAVECPKGRK